MEGGGNDRIIMIKVRKSHFICKNILLSTGTEKATYFLQETVHSTWHIRLMQSHTHYGWVTKTKKALFFFKRKQNKKETLQLKNRERIWKNGGEWTGMVETRRMKKFLAVGKAYMAIVRPTPGFKGRTVTFVSSGFSTERDRNFSGVALIAKFCVNIAFFGCRSRFSHIAASPYAKWQHQLNN